MMESKSNSTVYYDDNDNKMYEIHINNNVETIIRWNGVVKIGEEFRLNGKYHSINDEPAVMKQWVNYMGHYTNKTLEWWENGVLHRDNNPAVIKWENNCKILEMWYDHGILHRINGAAVTRWVNAVILSETWYKHGMLHRDNDEPAITKWDGFDVVKKEWWQENNRNRINNPAVIEYKNRVIIEEYWYRNNKLHNINDEPAIVWYRTYPKKNVEYWYINNEIHRDNDKPSCIVYGHDDIITQERWHRNNKLHRENGPAVINKSKCVREKCNHIGDEKCNTEERKYNYIEEKKWYNAGSLHNHNAPAYIKLCNNNMAISDWWENGNKLTISQIKEKYRNEMIPSITNNCDINIFDVIIDYLIWK